jgi:hypothetical protein
MSQVRPDSQPDRTAGTFRRMALDAGDANLGQTILRLAGLAEAAHRFEHAAAIAAQAASAQASVQVSVHATASDPVRTDADFEALLRLRTEVGR